MSDIAAPPASEPAPAPTPTTLPLALVLSVSPDGELGTPLTDEELNSYLRKHLGTDAEKQRNDAHILRDQLYRDGGVEEMKKVINAVFDDAKVKELRKKWVPYARFTNPLKRIVNEVSTVYAEPAKRSVADEAANETYQKVLEAIRFDEVMLQVSRLVNLHRALLVGFRVRRLPSLNTGDREPLVDTATPANVRALMHPNDDKLVIGWAIRASHRPSRASMTAPAWTLWTNHERASLKEDFSIIPGTVVEHKLGVCPWVPLTLSPPQPGFWPGEEGADLVAAHMSIWMQGVLLLKESKSATKQTMLQGDGTNMARGQASDSEVPGELADGQTATVVDMSMDLSLFRDTATHILDATGHDYGLPPAILNHEGVQSAEARDLMRKPLEEIRKNQQSPFYVFELQFVRVMAAVLAVDLPALGFNPDGFSIAFGEEQTYLDPVTRFDLFVKQRQAGMANTADFMAAGRRGYTPEMALLDIERNIELEQARLEKMKEFLRVSGALGAQTPAPPPPDPTKPNDGNPPPPPPSNVRGGNAGGA